MRIAETKERKRAAMGGRICSRYSLFKKNSRPKYRRSVVRFLETVGDSPLDFGIEIIPKVRNCQTVRMTPFFVAREFENALNEGR
ncbi:MAG: hypothetical protein D6679_13555 [Candidatus Hydrogenedentota bacterium]|nr:MAG: hypothetical protein D6679_13555 [Candidatus Hydrogenedentota bacterium]